VTDGGFTESAIAWRAERDRRQPLKPFPEVLGDADWRDGDAASGGPHDEPPRDDGAPPIGEPIDEHQRRDRPQEREGLIWYGDTPPTPPAYLVGETIPETGTAILGGQYGAAKTFVGADLAGGVIAGGDFAGRPVKRTGGVLWFAAEGETEIERRVYAAIEARGGDATQRQPFARQSGSVPCLTDKDALERLRALAAQAAHHLRATFDCDLALIAIDTLSAAAAFDDENSAGETQKVMTMLAILAREARALVLLIDHYGKLVDTGVRGSSAKSAAADAILACLGDRDQATGATTNRRLAITKLRAGPTGRVIPFELAQTADGLTCTVSWKADDHIEPPKTEGVKIWSKSLTIFRRALLEALSSVGKTTIPRAGMPEVRAVDREAVREEFFRLYPGETHKAKKDAFLRCVKDALERGVLCSINVGPDLGQTIFWTP
jgi:AAA domain